MPKSWAAMSLSSSFLLNIFVEEKDVPEISSLQRGLEKHYVLSNKA